MMESIIEDIKRDALKSLADMKEDQEIEDKSNLLHYHNLLTENIRNNNRQITRNSYLAIISIALYFFIFLNETPVSEMSILFFKIDDDTLLLNIIPIVFMFIYLKNITLWNNNINLIPLFESTSRKLYNLSTFTDTVNVVKPFSFLHHVTNYQYQSKKVNKFFKFPLSLAFLLFMIFPICFAVFSTAIISIKNEPSFIAYFCGIIVSILTLATIIQALNSHKD